MSLLMSKCHIVTAHIVLFFFACWVIFAFLSSTDFDFQNHIFQEYCTVSKCLDPDPDHFVEPDLCLNHRMVYWIYQGVTSYNFLIKLYFFFLSEDCFCFRKQCNPDQIIFAFHLGVHCLP